MKGALGVVPAAPLVVAAALLVVPPALAPVPAALVMVPTALLVLLPPLAAVPTSGFVASGALVATGCGATVLPPEEALSPQPMYIAQPERRGATPELAAPLELSAVWVAMTPGITGAASGASPAATGLPA
jgi:Meckel syndrome type 1 protein